MIKRYKCQFPKCDKEIQIRTKIKNPDSEYFGLNVCPYHANLEKSPKVKSDQTRRTEKARAEQRKDYPEFYRKHCELAEGSRCQECGERLMGHVSEIAHILKKTVVGGNPELATESENIIYLCGMYSENQCHTKFDSSLESRSQMKIFPLILEKFIIFQNKIKNWDTSEVKHIVEKFL